MDQEYQKWLDSLKVGDEVYCTYTINWSRNDYVRYDYVGKVIKITPTRVIKIGNLQFDKNGRLKGGGCGSIRPVTQDIKKKFLECDLQMRYWRNHANQK